MGRAERGGAGVLGSPRRTAAMEQAPPDLERLLQPAPLEPLGHPDAGLETAVGEEAEGARDDEGPGDGTVRRGAAEAARPGSGPSGRSWARLAGAGELGREAPR